MNYLSRLVSCCSSKNHRHHCESSTGEFVKNPVSSSKETENCPICLDDITSKKTRKCLPCGHTFHEQCILRWFKENATCPNCRMAFVVVFTK